MLNVGLAEPFSDTAATGPNAMPYRPLLHLPAITACALIGPLLLGFLPLDSPTSAQSPPITPPAAAPAKLATELPDSLPRVNSLTAGLNDSVSLDFSLPQTDGSTFALQLPFDSRFRVICFLGCDCPVVKLYTSRLNELAARFAAERVEFIGVNSNPQDPMPKLIEFTTRQELGFVMLKDHDGQLANRLGATRTPEVFLVDPLGQILYRGRIDDQYRPGVVTDSPKRDDLRLAIEQALRGEAVEIPSTQAAGCLMARRRPVDTDSPITFTDQVVRVLDRHCVECHRPGEIGPFSLVDYDEVIGWTDMILEVIELQRMPPWHASDLHGQFANARKMPEADKQILRDWVEAGAPFGNADKLPDSAQRAVAATPAVTPDQVIPMAAQPFTIPAEGTVEYQYFVTDPGFTEDRWVKAAEIIPGNRAVVHHGIVFVRPPDGVRLEGMGWLTAYVPGQRMPPPVSNLARKVPAGSKLVFQMHYTPTGSVEQDLSRLELQFAESEEVTEELITLIGINQGLEIPPGDPAAIAQGRTQRFPDRGRLLAISPHMHLRGKSFQVRTRDGQSEQILLDVPHYDFNWQHTYLLASPLELDSLDSLEFTATYDNSAANPFNPDPEEFVTWGDQTWEEMALVFYEVARPRGPIERQTASLPVDDPGESEEAAADRQEAKWQALADDFFRDLDRDRDGLIRYDEVDRAVQLRLFRRIDQNNDRVLDRNEVLNHLRKNQ
ncbi:MAG: alkyl hydroperoxide reductase [Planctomycetaceae bacterium]|nr:MAG: alkyl hydroperoxide reductase [Planctomycetaceae bacterium]